MVNMVNAIDRYFPQKLALFLFSTNRRTPNERKNGFATSVNHTFPCPFLSISLYYLPLELATKTLGSRNIQIPKLDKAINRLPLDLSIVNTSLGRFMLGYLDI